jgi:DNA-binding NtrC family response regulator
VGGAPSRIAETATLLVVEDDVLTRSAVCDALRYHRYKVLEASSAQEALAILSILPVELVFVDLHLPGEGDGLSVARFAHAHCPDTRVILTSGKVRAATIPDLPELGTFVGKPYLISRVLEMIRRTLDPPGEGDS